MSRYLPDTAAAAELKRESKEELKRRGKKRTKEERAMNLGEGIREQARKEVEE